MKTTLANYFEKDENKILLTDRAFLSLYSLFSFLKKNTTKKKVLITSTTCPSPVFAAIYAGLEPVFIDISLNDFLMDTKQTINKINEIHNELIAIVYVYIFGHVSEDINLIKENAVKYNIPIIEDVAQAFGAKINNKLAGTIGDFSVLSFGYSKQIDAGSGGAIIVNNSLDCISELNLILRNVQRFDFNSDLAEKYKKNFYDLRIRALQDYSLFKDYSSYTETYMRLYFKKTNVDWTLTNQKAINFIERNLKDFRNENAFYYHNELMELNHILILPTINNNYSIYRYTFLADTFENAQKISILLRNNNIHCSNLYLPVSRFFHNYNFEHALDLGRKAINLFVDVDKNSIFKAINIIKLFYKNEL